VPETPLGSGDVLVIVRDAGVSATTTAPAAPSQYTVLSPAATVNGDPVTGVPPTVTAALPVASPAIRYWAVPECVVVKLAPVSSAPCLANIATLG
jgi:hypothetical protein